MMTSRILSTGIALAWTVALALALAGCGHDPGDPGNAPPATGSLAITCLPHGLGAPWTLIRSDQLVAVGYGDSLLSDLPEGAQRFAWGALPGWTSPQPDTLMVQVSADQTVSLTGQYEVFHTNKGRVTVLPEPEELNPPWFISKDQMSIYRGAGQGEVWLPAGDYTFAWGVVGGHVSPQGGPIPLPIKAGETRDIRGMYRTDGTPVGTIQIDADPDSLRASWSLVDPAGVTRTGQGDATLYGMPPGSYHLTWLSDPRWQLPRDPDPTGTLRGLTTLTFRGDYLSPDPLAAENLVVDNGLLPGVVEVSWRSIDDVVVPVIEYLVLAAVEQPGVSLDWDSALVLGRYAPLGLGTVYHESFGPEAHLVPGTPYRITVRGRDFLDRLSPVGNSAAVMVDQGYQVRGTLVDYQGQPLAGIPLDIDFDGTSGTPQRVTTDDQGFFSGVSLWGGSKVRITTMAQVVQPGAWHDFDTGPMDSGTWQDISLTLIPRRGVDGSCPQLAGGFLTYVRAITKTDHPTNNRPNTRLNKWDHFPLTTFIPDYVNKYDLDMGALCSAAPTIWNDDMGAVFFTPASDSASADVVFRFGTDIPSVNGQVSVLDPPGNYFLGDVIPRKLEVYIAADMGLSQRVQEVALHELGHALGIAGHAECGTVGYLMYYSSSGALDHGPENAIHPDEKALVWCLRYLPQGVDMAGYQP